MDMINHIVRQLSIDLITDAGNPIIDYFNDLWNELYVIEINVYHNRGGEFIYFIMDNDIKKVLFYRDDENDTFWCKYDIYWSIFESKFNLSYHDIQDVTKILVENVLNARIAKPTSPSHSIPFDVENALNKKTL